MHVILCNHECNAFRRYIVGINHCETDQSGFNIGIEMGRPSCLSVTRGVKVQRIKGDGSTDVTREEP